MYRRHHFRAAAADAGPRRCPKKAQRIESGRLMGNGLQIELQDAAVGHTAVPGSVDLARHRADVTNAGNARQEREHATEPTDIARDHRGPQCHSGTVEEIRSGQDGTVAAAYRPTTEACC